MKNFFSTIVLCGLIILVGVITPSLAAPFLTQTDTLVLQPGAEGKDCYICDCSPTTNSPNGGVTLLYQGQYQTCYDRLLIQWDISALPAGANIISAEMWLYCYNLYTTRASGKMVYYRITKFWKEDSVTFATQPDTSHDITVTANRWPAGGYWHSVNVTPFVQGWHQGTFPNYGIYGHAIQTNGTCVAGFHSSDHATENQRPKLIIIYSTTTNVDPRNSYQPESFHLQQNYPNPFNPTTTIKYFLPHEELVSLKVFDLKGRETESLIEAKQARGNYEVIFDGRNLMGGIYFIKMRAGAFVDSRKAILIK